MKNVIKQQVVEIPAWKRIAKIIFKDIPKLPKNYLDIYSLKGFYVDSFGNIRHIRNDIASESSKNIFSNEDEAKAAVAMAQLTQLKSIYNDGWEPDWTSDNTIKVCIYFNGKNLTLGNAFSHRRFLTFKNSDVAKEFLENFRDLIMQAKPLL